MKWCCSADEVRLGGVILAESMMPLGSISSIRFTSSGGTGVVML
jgi:hypothetical protein